MVELRRNRRAACRSNPVDRSEVRARDVSAIFDHETPANIQPSFKSDTDVVPPSPYEPTFCNCKKAVQRDVEVYWKKTQPISVDLGVCPANAVSRNAQFSAFKK